MPFVEEVSTKPADPNAWTGANVLIVMPALFCALGQVEVAGLWQPQAIVTPHWRTRRPPLARRWKLFAPEHKGWF